MSHYGNSGVLHTYTPEAQPSKPESPVVNVARPVKPETKKVPKYIINPVLSKELPVEKLDALFMKSGFQARGEKSWRTVMDDSITALQLWHEEHLVGFARMSESEDARTCTFHDAVIDPDYRKNGLLTRMQSIAQGVITDMGYERAQIEAAPGTEEMYAHMGWQAQDIGRITLQGSNGIPAELPLTNPVPL